MKHPKKDLHLNCIDKALLALHSKSDPMVIHIILTLDSAVDDARLRAALMTVLRSYPNLRSTIRTGMLSQVRVPRETCEGEILSVWNPGSSEDWSRAEKDAISAWHESRLSEWMNMPLDAGEDQPCKVLLLKKTASEFSLVFTMHHSAVDGLQGCRFVGDVIQVYNGAAGNSSPTEPPSAGEGDDLVALARAHRPKVRHFYLKMIASLVQRFLVAPFYPKTRLCRNTSKPAAEMGICQGALNQHELWQIRSRSKSAGATVNDVLLAACFRTVEEWNSAHGKASRRISVMVPVDMSSGTRCPVRTNQAAFLSLSTTHQDRLDPQKLLAKVGQSTSRMMRDGIAFSIVYITHLCTHLPPVVPKAVARFLIASQIYIDSILLTNLGVVLRRETESAKGARMGGARVAGLVVIPPIVSPMGLSLCVDTYNDRLYVTLGYKKSQFSEAQARTFLNLYLHQVRGYQRTPEGLLAPEVKYREAPEKIPA